MMRSSIAARSCTNTRNPRNFFARIAYQPFPSQQKIRLGQPNQTTVDRGRDGEDASCSTRGIGEQRVGRGVAAHDAVQHDDIGGRQRSLRPIADLERGALGQTALVHEGASIRDGATIRDGAGAEVEAGHGARTVSKSGQSEIAGAAPDVEHAASLKAGFVQRAE